MSETHLSVFVLGFSFGITIVSLIWLLLEIRRGSRS